MTELCQVLFHVWHWQLVQVHSSIQTKQVKLWCDMTTRSVHTETKSNNSASEQTRWNSIICFKRLFYGVFPMGNVNYVSCAIIWTVDLLLWFGAAGADLFPCCLFFCNCGSIYVCNYWVQDKCPYRDVVSYVLTLVIVGHRLKLTNLSYIWQIYEGRNVKIGLSVPHTHTHAHKRWSSYMRINVE